MRDNRRAIFPAGEQRTFIENILVKLNRTVEQLANKLGVSSRNLRDWRREKLTLPTWAVIDLCKETQATFPENITLLEQYWSTKKAAPLGGKAVLKKYGHIGGDSNHRQKQWQNWWLQTGQLNRPKILQPKPFALAQPSTKLAEWVGIMLGDGGITPTQLVITLNRRDDSEYIEYVASIIQELFDVIPTRRDNLHDLGCRLVISRTGLVKYAQTLGLVVGHKIRQNIRIPAWIRSDREFSRACIRGLVDTDGSVFKHRYTVKNKSYIYTKISFSNRSGDLLADVQMILEQNGLRSRLTPLIDLRLESRTDVQRYFEIIGSSNPKHLRRYG